MPDISMCSSTSCPRRFECHRFTATPNPYRQSYANFYDPTENECPRYIPGKKLSEGDRALLELTALTEEYGGYDDELS